MAARTGRPTICTSTVGRSSATAETKEQIMSESTFDGGMLTRFSADLAQAVETAGRATVAVKARRRVPGSGVLWSPSGTVVTADHVLERDDEIKVVLPDGQEFGATLVGRDPTSDLAVLRIGANGVLAA